MQTMYKKPISVLHAIYQVPLFKANPDSHGSYILHLVNWFTTARYSLLNLATSDDITSGLPDDITMTMVTLTMGHGQMHLWVT